MKRFVRSCTSILLLTLCILSCLMVRTITASAAEIDLEELSAQIENQLAEEGNGKLAPAPDLSFDYSERGVTMTVNLPSNSIWYYRFYVWKNGTWNRIGTDRKENYCSYEIADSGITYHFTVRAVINKTFLTEYKNQSVYFCKTPSSLKATHISNGIKVSWDICNGINKYRVFWLNTKGKWVREADTYNNYYIDKNPKKDWANCYTVRGLDSDGNYCSGYKIGCLCYQGGPVNTESVVNNIVNQVQKGNSEFTYPNKYWNYSGIPNGADWCTGFCNYVIGKSCGSWRFAGEFHKGAKFDWNHEESTGYGNYNNPADWHPYTNQWAKWAATDGIFYQPYELVPSKGDIVFFVQNGKRDTYNNICHVGIVVSADGETVTTIEGNTGNASATAARVNLYTYNKSGTTYKSNRLFISGYIRMKDVYYRTIY